MREIRVSGRTGHSRILVGESISNLEGYCNARKKIVVTDCNVRQFHGKKFSKFRILEVGSTERSKTLETVSDLYEKFLEMELHHSSMVIGIGGGIVTDVAGFAASTYTRKLPFGFVPTTLLGQVDASIGGKNGVNFRGYKNLVGNFRQPGFVICDLDLLETLPQRELSNGFAEIAKAAAIADPELFAFLEKNHGKALSLERQAMERIVFDAIMIKTEIVARDETEDGERRKLNLGHTIGHGIEKVAGISHGEAVAIGMVAAANISVNQGLLPESDVERLKSLLLALELPIRIDADKAEIIDAIRKDKKREDEDINMSLLEGIGKCCVRKVKIEEINEAVGRI